MDEEQLAEKHRQTICAFVLRSRRVAAHSIARDSELLAKYQLPQVKITYTVETGRATFSVDLPNEEQFESAAARVRPLILNSEPTYHAKVMGALLYFAQRASLPPAAIAALRDWKKQWAAINPDNPGLSFYDVRQQEKDNEDQRITDRRLAFAWIYGDVVHADEERRAESQRFGVDERFRAAVPIIVRVILMSLYTLKVIEDMVTRGALPDLGDVFDEEVVVTRSVIVSEGRVYIADSFPEGVVPDSGPMGESPGPEWRTFDEAFPDLIRKAGEDADAGEKLSDEP